MSGVGVNRRHIWVPLLAVVAILGSVTVGCASEQASEPVTVARLIGAAAQFEGKACDLVLQYGMRQDDDPVVEMITRSDGYLHDNTGSILLVGGFQTWLQWNDKKEFHGKHVEVDGQGIWRLKGVLVRYRGKLPYLEIPE